MPHTIMIVIFLDSSWLTLNDVLENNLQENVLVKYYVPLYILP